MKKSSWKLAITAGLLAAALLSAQEGPAQQGPILEGLTQQGAAWEGALSSTEIPVAGDVAAPVPVGAAASIAYRDPETGKRLTVPPADVHRRLLEELSTTLNTSDEGLVEVPAPGGGVMVDLRGRFRSVSWVTLGADGWLSTHCDEHGPAGEPAHATINPRTVDLEE